MQLASHGLQNHAGGHAGLEGINTGVIVTTESTWGQQSLLRCVPPSKQAPPRLSSSFLFLFSRVCSPRALAHRTLEYLLAISSHEAVDSQHLILTRSCRLALQKKQPLGRKSSSGSVKYIPPSVQADKYLDEFTVYNKERVSRTRACVHSLFVARAQRPACSLSSDRAQIASTSRLLRCLLRSTTH